MLRNLFIPFILSASLSAFAQNKTNQFDAQGERNGRWVKTYKDSEQIRYEGTFKHGQEVGTFKFYQEESKKQPHATKTYHTKNDSVLLKFFTQKGKLVSEGNVIDKKREGKWKFYHKDNENIMMVETYHNDSLNGLKSIYFPNGKIAEKQTYQNGIKDGKNLVYAENGTLIQEYIYKSGQLNGPSKVYDAKGNLSSEGNYKDGLRDGIWKFYKNGKVDEIKEYPIERPKLKAKAKDAD